MSVWDLFTGFWSEHGVRTGTAPIWFEPIGPGRIDDPVLAARAGITAVPGRHYVQMTVRRMNLRTDELLTRKRYPVLHSQVTFDTTGGGVVTIPSIAGESSINGMNLAAGGSALAGSIPLTTAVPYHEGEVAMVAGLVSMKGEALLDRLASVVTQVTKLVPGAMAAGTTVATGVSVANAAIDMVESLFGATESDIVLGMHALFSPTVGTPLTSGLYALVDPRTHEESGFDLGDPDLLVWRDEELCYPHDGEDVKLRAQDWIVIEIGLDEHRGHTAYPDLVRLVDEAVKALTGDVENSRKLLNTAIISASVSDRIVAHDKVAVYAEMRAAWEETATAVGVTVTPAPSVPTEPAAAPGAAGRAVLAADAAPGLSAADFLV